ncbi:MAG TPA: LptF/LptG family permease [Gemmatimonadales bacterium]
MRLISRHILRSLTGPFLWGVAALTGMLLLQSLPPLIDQFGGRSLPAWIMFEAVLLFLPALVALTLPMAVLVSTLYGYSQLAAALEMVAMYANGVSVWRMARPALLAAAVIATINFLVFDQIMPRSNTAFVNLRQAAMNKSPTLALQQQVLNVLPAPSGYVLRADRIDPVTGGMHNVTIFDLPPYENTRRLIIADSGTMAESANGTDLILLLHHGEIYEFASDNSGQLQQTQFVNNKVTIRNVQSQLELTANQLNRGERELSTCELLDATAPQQWSVEYQRHQSEQYTSGDLRILSGLPQIPPAAVQVPPKFPPHCGVYRRVEAWFKRLMLPEQAAAQTPQQPVIQQPTTRQPAAQQPATKQPAAQQPAITQPAPTPINTSGNVLAPQHFLVPPITAGFNGLTTTAQQVSATRDNLNGAEETIRRYQVEYHQRFAIPLASFCFVLIGMALALKYPGSGIGLVIGGSLVIFLGFYILLQGGENIARAGHLNPAVALYSPLILFTVAGLTALASANREMGTARTAGPFEAIADLIRGLRR